MKASHCCALAALLALLLPPAASAQIMRLPYLQARAYEFNVFPSRPRTGEPRYLIVAVGCPGIEFMEQPRLAPAPQSQAILDVRLRALDHGCFTPRAFEATTHAIPIPERIGNSQVGEVLVRGILHRADGTELFRFEQLRNMMHSADVPDALTGAWLDPDSPGQGVYITRSLIPDAERTQTPAGPQPFHRMGMMVAWSTFDLDGQPMVLSGVAQDDGNPAQRIDLYRSAGGDFGFSARAATVEHWGQATIEYIGCGRMRFSWQARDARYPPGATELTQLVDTTAAPCDLPQLALRQFVTLNLVEPVIDTAPP